ncbi:kelch-like protein 17 [Erpetoichthys calabaricus]|uniref:kelch-like protein 17 n=1 Tax=Erpetoichthys calabaricus TaxID=27687 RepID=UPI0022349BA6|nr:kelch-like protein 17 [Erpetoichthys calabaricus]
MSPPYQSSFSLWTIFVWGITTIFRWLQKVFSVVCIWLLGPGISENCREMNNVQGTLDRPPALAVYSSGKETEELATIRTSGHTFQADLRRLTECSEYFRALSQSQMREMKDNIIDLSHIPSRAFCSFLEFSFYQNLEVTEVDLPEFIEAANYLLANHFLAACLRFLKIVLTPENYQFYLDFAKSITCEEMLVEIYSYLSAHMLELSSVCRSLELSDRYRIITLRSEGSLFLCTLKKENLTAGEGSGIDAARFLYLFESNEETGTWSQGSKLPFLADKWNFTTAVLYNYLFVIGGYRKKAKKGFEFHMASFRYNPMTNCWASVAPLLKRRRHFSTAVCEGYIFAVGGWYLDSLLAPDSSTALYTAVERYDPWSDTWVFVSSLPLTDFIFSVSLSHDIPLTTVLEDCIYVVGTIQRTGEKLVLKYNVKEDSWSELLPTLTRADTELSNLYFLGAVDKLYLIGGNSQENIVMTFCVKKQKWEKVKTMQKIALSGQGAILHHTAYMPAAEQNAILRIDLKSFSTELLPPLPISSFYEAVFHLCFKKDNHIY